MTVRSPFPPGSHRALLVAGVVAAFALVPLVAPAYVTELVLTALVFAMLGVSWNLLAGYAGQISLGHAAFFGLGAYVSAWLTTPAGADLPGWIAMPALPAIVVGALVAGLVALVVGPVIFRLRGHYFAIGTLALAFIIQIVLNNARWLSGGATGYYVRSPSVGVATVDGRLAMYYVGLVSTVAVVVATYYTVRSPLGLGMQAVRDDRPAADGLGVNPFRYKMWAFVLSSLFAGLAGGVYAQYTLYLNPESTLGIGWTIDTLIVVILGGMGTMLGPLLGTPLFLVLDNALAAVVQDLSTTVEGLLIILFVVALPHGLYGSLVEHVGSGEDEQRAAPSDD